jgi:REP element-mobilizing transposase RayT
MTSAQKPPGHRALRLGRYSEPGRIYFLTTVTHQRTRWFDDFNLACQVSRLHLDQSSFAGARCLAWVLMPDHWHGLIELGEGHDLRRVMQRFKSRSSFEVTRASGGIGPVWARGYHDHAMRADADIRRAARYLIANPIRAGLAGSAGAYPFWDAVWL